MKPPLAAGADTVAAGVGVGATGAATASGFGAATGAGPSGTTPLITGSWRLARSWLRRVTVVASSTSSAIL